MKLKRCFYSSYLLNHLFKIGRVFGSGKFLVLFCFSLNPRGTIQASLSALLLMFCAIERVQERSRGKHPWEGSQWNGRHTRHAKSEERHSDPQRGELTASCMPRTNTYLLLFSQIAHRKPEGDAKTVYEFLIPYSVWSWTIKYNISSSDELIL